jgi:hypothetical protein
MASLTLSFGHGSLLMQRLVACNDAASSFNTSRHFIPQTPDPSLCSIEYTQFFRLALAVSSAVVALVTIVIGERPAVSTTAWIVLHTVFVAHLAARFAAPVLSTLSKSLVEIGTDDTLVEFGSANVLHAVERILVSIVFDEAEAAWCFLEAVQAHNETLDLAASGF